MINSHVHYQNRVTLASYTRHTPDAVAMLDLFHSFETGIAHAISSFTRMKNNTVCEAELKSYLVFAVILKNNMTSLL